MEQYIKDSLAAGIIRPSFSPLGTGFFFVAAKRLCIDFWGLNDITIKNKYPGPLVNLPFESLQQATIFLKLDLCNVYHLIRIKEGDKWKTAFWDTSTTLSHPSCFSGPD